MNEIFRAIGMSKQAFHQSMDRHLLKLEEQQQLLPLVAQLRADHPGMAAREMYRLLKPQSMGRDRFEGFCFEQGYKLERKRSYQRTTNSLGVIRFPNLVAGRELTGVNQVWVSDITYYRIGETFYYLTFIVDLFSRRIVGYSVSKKLLTEHTTLPALKMALKQRQPAAGLIFHSDGGGQYYSKKFIALTAEHQIRNSMCESVYENPHAERINGTIKNYYLAEYNPQDFEDLRVKTHKAVRMYNLYKPHQALNRLSPAAYEALSTENEVLNKRKKEAKKEKMMIMVNEVY